MPPKKKPGPKKKENQTKRGSTCCCVVGCSLRQGGPDNLRSFKVLRKKDSVQNEKWAQAIRRQNFPEKEDWKQQNIRESVQIILLLDNHPLRPIIQTMFLASFLPTRTK